MAKVSDAEIAALAVGVPFRKYRIVLTDGDGVVLETWTQDDLGDVTKPLARQLLGAEIANEIAKIPEQ